MPDFAQSFVFGFLAFLFAELAIVKGIGVRYKRGVSIFTREYAKSFLWAIVSGISIGIFIITLSEIKPWNISGLFLAHSAVNATLMLILCVVVTFIAAFVCAYSVKRSLKDQIEFSN